MSINNITLQKPFIIIKQYDETSIQMDNTSFQFGIVQRVYETCDKFSLENIVLFKPEEADGFKTNSEYYFLIDENKLPFKMPLPA